jgi:alpha-glucosidase
MVYDKLYQYQFSFGDAMLIVPITSQEKTKKFYLPAGKWYDAYTDSITNGNSETAKEFPIYQLPIYIKESSVIPVQSLVQSTKEKPSDTLYLHIYAGQEKNIFTYYEDDGATLSYKTGNYCKRNIEFDGSKKQIVFSQQEGSYSSQFKYVELILHGFDEAVKNLTANDQSYQLSNDHIRILNPLDNLEDVYDKNSYKSSLDAMPAPMVKTVTITNSEKQINIEW